MKKTNGYFKNVVVANMNNIIKANNTYSKKGFTLFLCEDRDALEVSYNNSTYNISVVKRKKDLYWHLTPYKETFFETLVNNHFNTFEMVLCAIQDNEDIHKKGDLQCK